jgi:hypothetical protein
MKDDNILIFPQSRCRLSETQKNHSLYLYNGQFNERLKSQIKDPYGLQESELFLAHLLHNIAEQYQLEPAYAAQSISPFIPGLHSLVETVLSYCDAPDINNETIDIVNQLLAETLVNSFRHAQHLAHE